MPATLNAPQDTGSISATQKAQPGQTNIPTYRNESGLSTTIAPGGTIPASPAGQRPAFSNSSSTGSFQSAASTQSSYTPPAYTPPAYAAPPDATMPPPYGQPYPLIQPQKKSKAGVYIAVIVVLVLALCGVSSLAVMNLSSKSVSTSETISTSGSDNSNNNGTPTQTTSTTKNGTPAKDGYFPQNVRLSCGGCDDPILVTITGYTVDSGKGRTAWDVSLYNNTTETYSASYFYFEDFSLQGATDTNGVGASGDLMSSFGHTTDIPAEQSINDKLIFSFIPVKGERYTLNAKLYAYPTNGVNFNPVAFTFS